MKVASPWPRSCPRNILLDACLVYDDDATGEKLLDFLDNHPSVISLAKQIQEYKKPRITVQAIASQKSTTDICTEAWGTKAEEVAQAWKERGNRFYRSQRYEEAIKCYNLMICSSTNEATRFVGISNKAACFYSMDKKDETVVLDEYCLSHEKNMAEARKTKLTDRLKACADARSLTRFAELLTPSTTDRDPEYPMVRVESAGDCGRGLVAAYSLKVGESVFGAPVAPYAATLYEDLISNHCYTCFVRLDTYPIVPCEGCTEGFCSQACKDASRYHQAECRCDWNRSAPEMARLGLYLTLKETQDADAPYEPKKSNSFLFASPGPADPRPLSAIYGPEISIIQSLFTNESKLPFGGVLIHHMFDAILLSKLLAPLQLDRLRLFHNILRVNTNAFQTVHLFPEPEASSSVVESMQIRGVGFSIYGLPSITNHSCTPNTALTYDLDSNKLVLRATEPIAAGQAVYHCYGDLACNTPLVERRRRLKKRFYFDCHCAACEREETAPALPFQTETDISDFLVRHTRIASPALAGSIQKLLVIVAKRQKNFEMASQMYEVGQLGDDQLLLRANKLLVKLAQKYTLVKQIYDSLEDKSLAFAPKRNVASSTTPHSIVAAHDDAPTPTIGQNTREYPFDEGDAALEIPPLPKNQQIQSDFAAFYDAIAHCLTNQGAYMEAFRCLPKSTAILQRWFPLYTREMSVEYDKQAQLAWLIATNHFSTNTLEFLEEAFRVTKQAYNIRCIVFGSHGAQSQQLSSQLVSIHALIINKKKMRQQAEEEQVDPMDETTSH